MSTWTAADSRRLTRHGILAVNFHELRPENRDEAEARLRALARVGPSWDPEAPHDGPSVFVGFYDGYRETAMWGAELCNRIGLTARFFPIFVGDEPGQAGLSDDDLAALAERHEIGYHTASHLYITEVDEANVEAEVTGPVRRIEAATGRLPRLGAWCGGTRFDPTWVGNRVLRSLGVGHLISNWSIEPVPAA
ncbi:peptidoglycan/xylan/chitin deacetylase (PgdA/CDA1 family) [Friedmanniella endophytica]|uniref:Peptidoglycan/xylan/chitin deacetylase (PgdA/CDA1 family) n=1 Tax=Microlunatus kandeliicorticis TaxID=1759536 RepID=A0A7W3P479_9ACTN|nr:polysaccharide deacetylase family protein [Microlunatus kandeliicorticis]MBA8792555.1 peptidoglycan/xylan/chitin deacetylase (PgdA/CDA1 family) [Microlunatus kandeliicorticis]